MIKELGIPGISLNPAEAWGIPSIGITGLQRLRRQHRRAVHEPEQGVRVHRQRVVDSRPALVQGRRQHPLRPCTTRSATSSRAAISSSSTIATGYAVRRLPARLPAAVRIGGGAGGDEVPRAQPGVLLHRHVEGPLEHDARSRPALRIHAALARQERHADERVHPVPRHDAERAGSVAAIRCWCASAAATSTRTPCSASRPNIQVARDGRLGDRLVFDDKKNFAPRVGWAWTPSEKWSFRAGAGIFYMQDTGNPRFDMARNLSGRRRDNTLLADAGSDVRRAVPGRRRRANDCGVAPPLVCLTNVYVLGNMPDRKTPYMFQYLFNVQRELGGSTALEVGYLGSHSYRLERMFDWNETIPGVTGIGAEPEAVSGVHQGPGDRQRRRGQVQLAGRQADPAAPRRIVGARRLHALEVDGQRQRHPHAQRRHAVPAEQLLPRLRVGACRSSTCAIGSSRRCSTSCRSAPASRSCRAASAARFSAGGRSARSSRSRAASRERPTSAPIGRTPAAARIVRTSTGQDPNCRATSRRSRGGSTPTRSRCNALGTCGNAGRNTFYRPGHHQRRRVDHPELPARRGKIAAVPARGVQRVEQPDLERPEHDDDEPALRHDQQHEKADARAAARREVRVLRAGFKISRGLS